LRYLDRFECQNGEWRIAHRKVAVDWRYTLPLDAGSGQPFAADWHIGRRDRTDPSYAEVQPVGASGA
jgi:hypothetical protein